MSRRGGLMIRLGPIVIMTRRRMEEQELLAYRLGQSTRGRHLRPV